MTASLDVVGRQTGENQPGVTVRQDGSRPDDFAGRELGTGHVRNHALTGKAVVLVRDARVEVVGCQIPAEHLATLELASSSRPVTLMRATKSASVCGRLETAASPGALKTVPGALTGSPSLFDRPLPPRRGEMLPCLCRPSRGVS